MQTRGLCLLAAMVGLYVSAPEQAAASVFWNHSVRSSVVSVCFAGDATTQRPDRVAEVLSDIQNFTYYANVDFNYLGACPAPTTQANGDDYYGGDIRVALRYTNVDALGPVPGDGCPMFLDENGFYNGKNDDWGSWSNPPDELAQNRACQYNLKLGDDPWDSDPYLNHTLHEFGHALGLAHEHERADVNLDCTEDGYGANRTTYLTSYDSNSVMHYKFSSCGIAGNYDTDGFSGRDQLALHILYPESNRVVEYEGRTVVQVGEVLSLRSAWVDRGGYMSIASPLFGWSLNGTVYSTSPYLSVYMMAAGDYSLSVSQVDLLGRTYALSSTVKVLSTEDFEATVSGPVAALTL